jgi:DNA-directed RNA polymerase subunit RPC12/RpoP
MAVSEKDYVVLPEAGFRKKRAQGWLEILRRWLVQCPECSEACLAVGVRENDEYVCRNCGHRFAIKSQTQRETSGVLK